MKNKIAFLLGAGVSIPSGMDKTGELTEKVLKGENIVRSSGKYVYKDTPDNFQYIYENDYINRIKKLFHILQNNLGNHYSFIDREMNYEDYFYMVDSMHSDQHGEFENPLVEYFSDYLFKVHTSLFEPLCDLYSPISLIDLMSEAKKYIRYIIAYNLNKSSDNLCQFRLFNEITHEKSVDKSFIFTLNHDLLIETALLQQGINFSDGFEDNGNDVRIWKRNTFIEKFNLLKLHGSINWGIVDSDDPYERRVRIYPVDECLYIDEGPQIIVGSMNKIREYSRGNIFELQCLFSEYLSKCNRLIISGYSFGDQGINSRIINWLFGSRDRKIIMIHKNAEELFLNSRYAIRRIWESQKNGKSDLIKVIPKWFQETNWQEIKEHL